MAAAYLIGIQKTWGTEVYLQDAGTYAPALGADIYGTIASPSPHLQSFLGKTVAFTPSSGEARLYADDEVRSEIEPTLQ